VVREVKAPVLVVRALPPDQNAAPEAVFRRVLTLEESEGDSVAGDMARALAGTFDGEVTTSAPDELCGLPELVGATAVVVPASGDKRLRWLGESTERILRACTLPTVFVPRTPAARLDRDQHVDDLANVD
jgi:hypothetical protein